MRDKFFPGCSLCDKSSGPASKFETGMQMAERLKRANAFPGGTHAQLSLSKVIASSGLEESTLGLV